MTPASRCAACAEVAGAVHAPGGVIVDDGPWFVSHHTQAAVRAAGLQSRRRATDYIVRGNSEFLLRKTVGPLTWVQAERRVMSGGVWRTILSQGSIEHSVRCTGASRACAKHV